MKIDALIEHGIPPSFIDKFKKEGILDLYPPQDSAIENGLLEGKNLLMAVPTASGKTLTAALATISRLSNSPTKAVYIVPLVALASEKYNYFKELLGDRWKVALSVGSLDSTDPRLSDYDFIVSTTEKLDSLMRHSARWVGEIGLVIIDEVHLLNDFSRGPTLEVLITRLKEAIPNAQFLALSATVSNSGEVAEWMDAKEIVSDFRPVKLYEGVSYGRRIDFIEKAGYELPSSQQEESIIENTMDMKKQALYFVSSRRNSEGLALRLTKPIKKRLDSVEREQLKDLSAKILNTLETPTAQCRKLAEVVKYGSAFHHAGLVRQQKALVEEGFRKGIIKSISATPTLAMGVNLPAFRVVIRDSKRFYRGRGANFIPVLEYKQFVGRAGRPQYDEYGESILVARTEDEADALTERFILGEPEKVTSKLAVEWVFRTHTLALVASRFTNTKKELFDFFEKTLYAYQYGDMSILEEKIEDMLDKLEDWGFVFIKGGKVSPTRIGKRVSELYLDPLTAHGFLKSLDKAESRKKNYTFGFTQVITNSMEMEPLLSVSSGESTEIEETIAERGMMFLTNIPEMWDFEFERFTRSVKTALLMEAWMQEHSEDHILSQFKVAPGELRNRLFIADWLSYSLSELALLYGAKEQLKDIRKLRVRLKYGVREELLPLVRLRSIGRVRARKLFKAGFKTVASLKEARLDSISRIVGPSIAYNIKEQLDEDFGKKNTRPKREPSPTRQSRLEGY